MHLQCKTQPGPPNVFLPISRQVQNKRNGVGSFWASHNWGTWGEKFFFISVNQKATKYLLKDENGQNTNTFFPNDGLTEDLMQFYLIYFESPWLWDVNFRTATVDWLYFDYIILLTLINSLVSSEGQNSIDGRVLWSQDLSELATTKAWWSDLDVMLVHCRVNQSIKFAGTVKTRV